MTGEMKLWTFWTLNYERVTSRRNVGANSRRARIVAAQSEAQSKLE